MESPVDCPFTSRSLDNSLRILNTFRSITTEVRFSVRLGGNWRSRLRLMRDFFMSHVLFALPRSMVNRERQIVTRSGVKLSYRLNRGDLQGIREVWCDEAYRLPFATPPGALLDLGANIGLTSLWMATHGHFTQIIAVEPNHENAVLIAKNYAQNGIPGQIIEAAVGPGDGTVRFSKSAWSNLGRVADDGDPVRMISVETIFKDFGLDVVGVAKVDIEGGEQALFLGPTEWLGRVRAMIVEFHPDIVDYPRLTSQVRACGFDYIPASPANMDCFLRPAADR
jgi:FkbM family methyltransferase